MSDTPLKYRFDKLKNIVRRLIDFQVRLILAVFYLVVIVPLGLIIVVFRDYLRIRTAPAWQERRPIRDIPDFLKGQ